MTYHVSSRLPRSSNLTCTLVYASRNHPSHSCRDHNRECNSCDHSAFESHQFSIRGHIRFVLSRFMEAQDFQVFFDVLELMQALVVGSVVLSVINPLGFSEHPPINLNIMTPHNTLSAWVKWAKAQHATKKNIVKPCFNKWDSTKCVLFFSILNVSIISLFNMFSHLLAGIPYQSL